MNEKNPVPKEHFYAFLFFCLIITLIGISFSPKVHDYAVGEDALLEGGTAFFCFLGAYFCFAICVLRKKYLSRISILYILGALFFIFIGGEEASWGHRIFILKPIILSEVANRQREFNIHNFPQFAHFIQYVGSSVVAVAIGVFPLLAVFSRKIRSLCIKIGIPLMPKIVIFGIWMGTLFLVMIPNYQIYPDINYAFGFAWTKVPFTEFREFYFSFMIFAYIFAEYFYLIKYKRDYEY